MNLEELAKLFFPKFQFNENTEIILDTCSIKRIPLDSHNNPRITFSNYPLILTTKICQEMYRINIPRKIQNFMYDHVNKIINPEISQQNYNLIYPANNKLPHLGITDAQIISYSIDRANENKKTIIITDDGQILNRIKYLRKHCRERKKFSKRIIAFGLMTHTNNQEPFYTSSI